MSRPELFVVCGSLADDATRAFVQRLGQRYLAELAWAGAADADLGPDIEVRRFDAAVPPSASDARGRLAETLARARARGAWSAELLEFLHHEHARYRAIVFLSYASPLTAFGLPLVPERAVLVPLLEARDADLGEPPYRALFHLPRAIGYRDAAERDRVQSTVRNEQVPYELVSLGDQDGGDRAFDRLVATALYA